MLTSNFRLGKLYFVRLLFVNLFYLSLASFLFSCQWSQDPIENKPDFIKNGAPKKKPVVPVPMTSEAIRLHGPLMVTANEDENLEIGFEAKVLVDHYELQGLQVLNEEQFEGIQVDPISWVIRWTPQRNSLSENYSVTKVLKVRALGRPRDQMELPWIQSEREVTIIVQRKIVAPRLVEVSASQGFFREGGVFYLIIEVEDVTGSGKVDYQPSIELLPPADNSSEKIRNLAGYTQFISAGKSGTAPDRWRFRYKVDLSGVELTDSVVDGGMQFRVRGGFGGASAPTSFTVPIYTKLRTPIFIGFPDTVKISTKSQLKLEFIIFDSMNEGRVMVNSTLSRIPKGATLDCVTVNSVSQLRCHLVWNPDPDDEGKWHPVSLQVTSENRDSRDTYIEKVWLRSFIYVGAESNKDQWPDSPSVEEKSFDKEKNSNQDDRENSNDTTY